MEMTAMLIGFLFFLAMLMALGTIAGMAHSHGGKALAALNGQSRHPAREMERPYSPARRPRSVAPFHRERPRLHPARVA